MIEETQEEVDETQSKMEYTTKQIQKFIQENGTQNYMHFFDDLLYVLMYVCVYKYVNEALQEALIGAVWWWYYPLWRSYYFCLYFLHDDSFQDLLGTKFSATVAEPYGKTNGFYLKNVLEF